MSVINAVAEFERDLLIAHIHTGLPGKEQGKVLGRPRSLMAARKQVVREKLGGAPVSELSSDHGVSRQTIQRARREARKTNAVPPGDLKVRHSSLCTRTMLRATFKCQCERHTDCKL